MSMSAHDIAAQRAGSKKRAVISSSDVENESVAKAPRVKRQATATKQTVRRSGAASAALLPLPSPERVASTSNHADPVGHPWFGVVERSVPRKISISIDMAMRALGGLLLPSMASYMLYSAYHFQSSRKGADELVAISIAYVLGEPVSAKDIPSVFQAVSKYFMFKQKEAAAAKSAISAWVFANDKRTYPDRPARQMTNSTAGSIIKSTVDILFPEVDDFAVYCQDQALATIMSEPSHPVDLKALVIDDYSRNGNTAFWPRLMVLFTVMSFLLDFHMISLKKKWSYLDFVSVFWRNENDFAGIFAKHTRNGTIEKRKCQVDLVEELHSEFEYASPSDFYAELVDDKGHAVRLPSLSAKAAALLSLIYTQYTSITNGTTLETFLTTLAATGQIEVNGPKAITRHERRFAIPEAELREIARLQCAEPGISIVKLTELVNKWAVEHEFRKAESGRTVQGFTAILLKSRAQQLADLRA